MAAPSGRFWMPMPSASAAAPDMPSPSAASAKEKTGEHQPHRRQQQPRRRGEPAGNAEVRRLLDGGQQQAPDAGRRHHPGGEAKHGSLELGPGLLHKEKYHRSP